MANGLGLNQREFNKEGRTIADLVDGLKIGAATPEEMIQMGENPLLVKEAVQYIKDTQQPPAPVIRGGLGDVPVYPHESDFYTSPGGAEKGIRVSDTKETSSFEKYKKALGK